ncbi:MAG: hypothetical protein ACHQ50_03040 [Fimbriimonadales bacterium]
MTAIFALALAIQNGNPVSEVVDPGAKVVSVQAIVKLPEMGGHEQAETRLIAETMADQVEGYSQSEMRDIAARAGEKLRITAMPDHLRIQIGVLPGDLKPAIGYVSQILRNAAFPADSLNAAMAEIPFRSRSLWATALQPFNVVFNRVRREDVVDLYHRISRPENVWLSVGGPMRPGEAEDAWSTETRDWTPGKLPRPSPDVAPPAAMAYVPGTESMIELRGKEIPASDPAIPVRILALIGLGSGKGSSMFEVLRVKHGWSYRQEALLWPTARGFVPRLIMASGDKTPPEELAKAMKQELTDAVNSWTEADVARARGMAEGILMRGVEMSPLYFNPSWPATDSLHDRTFMAGYWRMKTGREWDPHKLLGQMALVTLPELKEAALEILSVSIPCILPARG